MNKTASKSNTISSIGAFAGNNYNCYHSTIKSDRVALISPSNYQLINDGDIQIYRECRNKNRFKKIHFFRRWKNYQIHLDQSEITSTKVCYSIILNNRIVSIAHRMNSMRNIWIHR